MTAVLEVPEGLLRRRASAQRLVLPLACAAVTMTGVDTAVVNVALPSMQADLGVGASTVQWVVVVYGLFLGGFLLLGGRLADRLGRRRMYIAGLVVFTVASLVSGSVHSAGLLIIARALQGLGAALAGPAALSLLAVTFAEGAERNRAIGVFGAVGGIGGTLGVVLGGLLAGGPGWRWAFLINVPVGAVLVLVALCGLPRDERRPRRQHRLDVAGAVSVTGGLLLLVYALNLGAERGWSSTAAVLTLAGGVVLLAMFLLVEMRSAEPLMPLRIWRNRTMAAANVAAFCVYSALLGFIFLGSLLMQDILGYSPMVAGVAWLATTGTVFVTAMAGRGLVTRFGVVRVVAAAFVVVAAGALWLTQVPATASYWSDVAPAFLLIGVGFGLCGPALRIGALTGVAAFDSGLVAGLVETSSETGGAAGVAVVTTALAAGGGLAGFHHGFAIVAVLATVGLLVSAAGFARRAAD
jgi:EmrB/QacA subfamily drug resistance transporter